MSRYMQKAKREAILWSRGVLANPKALIGDTETTGFGRLAEMVQLGIINMQGEVVMKTFLHPTSEIHPRAQAAHGLDEEALRSSPEYPSIHEQLVALVEDKVMVAYNAEFDEGIFESTARRYGFTAPVVHSWQCAMLKYAAFNGEWNYRYRNFKWVKLAVAATQMGIAIDGTHEALQDCYLTLEVIKAMAATPLDEEK